MVNGFTAGRSVGTNAEAHVRKNYVFNTDLKDFFPSITARMVMHTLEDLGVKPEVARYISVLCTITTEGDDLPEDVLPQGSPASPVLSNIVCRKMDRHIDWLVRKYGVTDTRYADDMTLSSMHSVYGKNSTFLKEFLDIISGYGFTVNEAKTRLQKKGSRQEVTGIIVSDRANVCRKYIKNLRAEIFHMEMEGFSRKQYRSVRGKVACDDAVACFREIAEYDGDALVFEDGLKLAKDTFEQKIRELCPLKRFMSEGDVYDLVFDGWEDYGEHIRERCRKVALELKRDRSAELIRQTTAEAVIVPAIRRIGRPYHLEYQKYRLKVSLLTEQARVFEFYIRYRDFTNQEIIGSIPERTGMFWSI